MPNIFQRAINALLGTKFGEPKQVPPSQPPPVPPERVNVPVPPAPAPVPVQRVAAQPTAQAPPRIVPQQPGRMLHLTSIVPADNYHPFDRQRTLDIPMSAAQYEKYLDLQAEGKPKAARVYAVAEVYGVPALVRTSWDEDFDYDLEDMYDWPDFDDGDTAGGFE